MEWFNGGIPQAIQAAKIAKGIFAVVVVNGNRLKCVLSDRQRSGIDKCWWLRLEPH